MAPGAMGFFPLVARYGTRWPKQFVDAAAGRAMYSMDILLVFSKSDVQQ